MFAPAVEALYKGGAVHWDASDLTDGAVATMSDLAGMFPLVAVNAPTAASGVTNFDGSNDVMQGAEVLGRNQVHIVPGVEYVREFSLPDADGSDPGQGFSIAGFARDTDGTWWATNGGKNFDGSTAERRQSIVHLSADFSTNLGEIDIDALWENDESPQGVALDAANNWLWVLDPTGQAIRSVNRDGTRNVGKDIDRGYIVGSVCMAEAGDAIWVMSRGNGDATIQKIMTDGSKTVLVNGTVSLNSRHDHIFEYGGLLYISCGTNGAQAYVEALDAVTLARLGRAMLPYPDAPDGLVGLEGIWIGPDGQCLVAHNGYFHYGNPDGTNTQAPLTFPRSNIVIEYTLPVIASKDFDLFFLGSVDPSGTDCILQFGSPVESRQDIPSIALFSNENKASLELRKNTTISAAETWPGSSQILTMWRCFTSRCGTMSSTATETAFSWALRRSAAIRTGSSGSPTSAPSWVDR